MIFTLSITIAASSQNGFFHLYRDSATLVQDANRIVAEFVFESNAIAPIFTSPAKAVLNTKPFLIFYSQKSNEINLPMWNQVIGPQMDFFMRLAATAEKLETFDDCEQIPQ